MINREFGDYTISRELGQGGMAVVYEAISKKDGQKIALKTLSPKLANDPQYMIRFRREAKIAKGLKHANIVNTYNYGVYDGTYFICMEYVSGKSLDRIIKHYGCLDIRTALTITYHAARAIAFAHSKGIIHRDIKPQNIMLTEQNEIKVMDFGLAKPMMSGETLTETGGVIGTPLYMSPEQCRGGKVKAGTDIYSLGVVLFQMLTGRLPFKGNTAMEIMRRVIEDKVPVASAYRAEIPNHVNQIVIDMMNKKPADRYVSAQALCTVLERCLSHEDLGASDNESDQFEIDDKLMKSLLNIQVGNTPKDLRPVFDLAETSTKLLKTFALPLALVAAIMMAPFLLTTLKNASSPAGPIGGQDGPFLTNASFPTTEGTNWSYKTDRDAIYKSSIHSLFVRDGLVGLDIDYDWPPTKSYWTDTLKFRGQTLFKPDGMYEYSFYQKPELKFDGEIVQVVDHCIKLPLSLGMRWSAETTARKGEFRRSQYNPIGSNDMPMIRSYYLADSIETIEVPQGTYTCIKIVRGKTRPTSDRYEEAYWYAEGIGLVKFQFILRETVEVGELEVFHTTTHE